MREVAFPNSALHPQVSFCFSFLGLTVETPQGRFFHLGQRPCPSAKSEPTNEYLGETRKGSEKHHLHKLKNMQNCHSQNMKKNHKNYVYEHR